VSVVALGEWLGNRRCVNGDAVNAVLREPKGKERTRMSRAAVAGVTIGRAYRIEADPDSRLIGFVWKRGAAWHTDRSSERFFTRREAIEALKEQNAR
jgi:hypothetical protein